MPDSDEEFITEDEDEIGPALVKRLRERLAKAVEEKQQYLDQWQRSRADFTNFKREEALMHQEKEQRIKAEFIESLLPALDTFEIALKHEHPKELDLVHKQLLGSLKKLGVEQFGAAGERYDPHLHEALAGEGEVVATVERSGYKIENKIIRPAQITLQ